MTSETKNRITDINNGIIPEGYKKTKVGIVPVEWKQVKLGEILKQRKTLMCVSEDAPLLSFTIEEGVIEPTDKKTNKRDFLIKDISTKKFALTEVGDIIYNPANLKFGAIHRNDLRKGVVSPIYGIFYGKQDSVFMGNLLHNQRFIDYAKIYTEGTVEKLKTLKAETFLKLKVVIPPLPEQKKIAEILSTQDKLIELQEHKINQLKTLKKGYLQKMFPKKGCKYPELRFKGFTDAWEQRKVTELGEIYIGLVTTMTSHYTDRGTLLIRNSDIKDGRFEFCDNPIYLDNEFANQNSSRKHKVGDIITVHTGDIGTSAVITEKEAGSIGFATIVTRPNKEKITSEYLCAYLNTDSHKNFAMNISTGDGRNNYNLKDYYECVVPVPSISEQRKISGFIDGVNNLITLHQRKLDEEKQKKKALMQLLLTGKVRVKL